MNPLKKNFSIAFTLIDLEKGELIPNLNKSIGNFIVRHLKTQVKTEIVEKTVPNGIKNDEIYEEKVSEMIYQYTNVEFS